MLKQCLAQSNCGGCYRTNFSIQIQLKFKSLNRCRMTILCIWSTVRFGNFMQFEWCDDHVLILSLFWIWFWKWQALPMPIFWHDEMWKKHSRFNIRRISYSGTKKVNLILKKPSLLFWMLTHFCVQNLFKQDNHAIIK